MSASGIVTKVPVDVGGPGCPETSPPTALRQKRGLATALATVPAVIVVSAVAVVFTVPSAATVAISALAASAAMAPTVVGREREIGMFGDQWFVHEMASTTEAIVGARMSFRSWLGEQDVDAETIEDLSVVISELAANAVAAAVSDDTAIEVRAWRDGAVVIIEVENHHDAGAGGVVFHNESDPLRGHGQGLVIVTAYTDSVEVIPPHQEAGLVVRCRKAIAGTG